LIDQVTKDVVTATNNDTGVTGLNPGLKFGHSFPNIAYFFA
jgi:hypothetical protein